MSEAKATASLDLAIWPGHDVDRGLTGGSVLAISLPRTEDGGLLVSPTGSSFGRL